MCHFFPYREKFRIFAVNLYLATGQTGIDLHFHFAYVLCYGITLELQPPGRRSTGAGPHVVWDTQEITSPQQIKLVVSENRVSVIEITLHDF